MFVVRHKTTGKYLNPGNGASHWEGEGGIVPRIFHSLRGAKAFQASWARGIVSVGKSYDWETGYTENTGLRIEDRGRRKDMLEIIPVILTFGEPL